MHHGIPGALTRGQDTGDGFPQKEALVTVTFSEDGGFTMVLTLIDLGSKKARDAARDAAGDAAADAPKDPAG